MGKAARSFCQRASGERASQSCLPLDTLLTRTPFLTLYMCSFPRSFASPLGRGCKTCTYLSFAACLRVRHPIFPICYHPVLPFIQEVEEGDGEMGKCGERNIARQTRQWEHSPEGHRQCLSECSHISPLGSCTNLMALSWSIFSNFQSFLEKQKAITPTLPQRQDPMEAEGRLQLLCAMQAVVWVYLPLQMLCLP